jgi:hypothetical protein
MRHVLLVVDYWVLREKLQHVRDMRVAPADASDDLTLAYLFGEPLFVHARCA